MTWQEPFQQSRSRVAECRKESGCPRPEAQTICQKQGDDEGREGREDGRELISSFACFAPCVVTSFLSDDLWKLVSYHFSQ